MSYENKLLQMKSLLKKTPDPKAEKTIVRRKPDTPPYADKWERAGLEIVENDFGMLFRKRTLYPHRHLHGKYRLNQYFQSLELWKEAGDIHPFYVAEDEDIVFFDTETTGLKGAGTLIFLIGFLKVKDQGVELTQYVLADPANEAAFLFETELWNGPKTLVSYNGKSFDWPQLETRWTLNRTSLPKLCEHRHIDLLIGTRRMWKDEMDRFKLTRIEEEKLGFKRKGDIPGHLAPAIYLDAVKSGNPEVLLKVLKHNEWDIVSLLTLFSQSTELLLSGERSESATTYTNIGKWYSDLKAAAKGQELFEYVTETFLTDTSNAFYFLGLQLKREKLYTEAVDSFERSLDGVVGRRRMDAYIELSKIHEHKLRNIPEALSATEKAIGLAEHQLFQTKEARDRFVANLRKRKERLEIKRIFPGEAQSSTGNGEKTTRD